MKTAYLLAADIGGTNSRFALFRLVREGTAVWLEMVPQSGLTLSTPVYFSFSELLRELAYKPTPGGFHLLPGPGDQAPFPLAALAFGVPGAVKEGFCHAPNIRWPLSTREAQEIGGLERVMLFNDFAAQGEACLYPELLALTQVLPGRPATEAPAAIIGAGTGLGRALLLPEGVWPPYAPGQPFSGRLSLAARRGRVLPSEGGHAVFPFIGSEEYAFAEFLLRVSGRQEPIGDLVVSGYGLAALFAFHSGASPDAPLLPGPQVTLRLHEQPNVLKWLARFYGRACRNYALETLALGGIYISGGLAANVPGLVTHPAFAEAFRFSHGQSGLLRDLPVHHVTNPASGLWGAALRGAELLIGG